MATTRTDPWNPGTHEKFRSEWAHPFHDLAALHERLGVRSTLGVDASPAEIFRRILVWGRLPPARGVETASGG